MSDTPSESDLAMAQAGQTAEALADLNRPSAEEQRAADQESAELLDAGASQLAEKDIRPTDIYTRVNTAHGGTSVLSQNPYTFSDDIARGNLPPTATDPDPDAQPTEPEGGGEGEGEEPEVDPQAEGDEPAGEQRAAVYPNIAHQLGTPEDLLYRETGLIATTVSNVDGVSIVNVDPNAEEVEDAVAGDTAPLGGPAEDKKTLESEGLGTEDAAGAETEDGETVEQVESDYDPGAHTVAEVNQYVEDHPEEADAIYAAEEAGKGRAGILG